MADSQVKTANICNITSSTLLNSNAGGSGTYISDNSISVYMSGTATWSGTYCQYTNDYAVVDDYYTISFTPICATNSTLQIEVAGTAKKITFTSGTRTSVTIQATSTSRYVAFYGGDTVEKTVIIKDIQIEKGETATVYRPYSATGWVHSLRKLTTATEAVENPLYSDGTAITAYTLKGNEEHTGTPSPSNPVMPNGVGDMSSNLINYQLLFSDNPIRETENFRYYRLSVKPNTQYTLKSNAPSTITPSAQTTFLYGDSDTMTTANNGVYSDIANTVTSTAEGYIFVAIRKYYQYITEPTETDFANGTYTIMINEGSTALPYEPYGQYKIPISTFQTVNNYLGSIQSTRQIQKLVLTGEEDWIYQSQYSRFVTEVTNVAITGLRYTPFLCTHYQPISDGRAIENVPNNAAYLALTGTATGTLNIKTDAFTSETAFSEFLATQYAAGTPVTVWVVMYNAQTAAINEPLMAITTNDSVVHADSISNAVSIPTTEGANSITVDTTVQPSEFSATWTGWHDSSVKEYDGSDWQ